MGGFHADIFYVIPGSTRDLIDKNWIPAFAGMTDNGLLFLFLFLSLNNNCFAFEIPACGTNPMRENHRLAIRTGIKP